MAESVAMSVCLRRSVGGLPDALERFDTVELLFFAGGDEFLNLFAERIHARIGMAPGIDKSGLIERSDDALDVGQFEKP